jgi:hypothetical protein
MKINSKVPKRQQPVLDYMRTIKPVSRTLDDLIKALIAVSKGAKLETLPKSVRVNKAFDGFHTGTEGEYVMGFVKTNNTLKLRVQRGYIAMEQGDPKAILAKHLKMSDRFHVAFVSPKKVTNGTSWWNPGFEVVILRDGTLYSGVSSAGMLTSM